MAYCDTDSAFVTPSKIGREVAAAFAGLTRTERRRHSSRTRLRAKPQGLSIRRTVRTLNPDSSAFPPRGTVSSFGIVRVAWTSSGKQRRTTVSALIRPGEIEKSVSHNSGKELSRKARPPQKPTPEFQRLPNSLCRVPICFHGSADLVRFGRLRS
jgi:hypothetical protein